MEGVDETDDLEGEEFSYVSYEHNHVEEKWKTYLPRRSRRGLASLRLEQSLLLFRLLFGIPGRLRFSLLLSLEADLLGTKILRELEIFIREWFLARDAHGIRRPRMVFLTVALDSIK